MRPYASRSPGFTDHETAGATPDAMDPGRSVRPITHKHMESHDHVQPSQ